MLAVPSAGCSQIFLRTAGGEAGMSCIELTLVEAFTLMNCDVKRCLMSFYRSYPNYMYSCKWTNRIGYHVSQSRCDGGFFLLTSSMMSINEGTEDYGVIPGRENKAYNLSCSNNLYLEKTAYSLIIAKTPGGRVL